MIKTKSRRKRGQGRGRGERVDSEGSKAQQTHVIIDARTSGKHEMAGNMNDSDPSSQGKFDRTARIKTALVMILRFGVFHIFR